MQIRYKKSGLDPEIKTYGNKKLAFISNLKSIDLINPDTIEAIVLKDSALISAVRKNDQLYLCPLFLMEKPIRQVDGAFDPYQPYSIFDKIDQIQQNILPYRKKDLPQKGADALLIKLLRFLCSRNIDLKPTPSRSSNIGYLIELLEDLSYETSRIHLVKSMEQYVHLGYFKSKILDQLNLCHECQGSYLHFSECCTQCGHPGMKTESLVHHFRCAYVGPESDFAKNGQMICPKCDKTLKHIGIDYDKPSEINTCTHCHHKSQETEMKARCIDCSSENQLSQLSSFNISQYTPTEAGKQLSLQNKWAQRVDEPSDPLIESDLEPFGIYQLLKTHEVRKREFYTNELIELQVHTDTLLRQRLSDNSKMKLLIELAEIGKSYLRQNDLVSIDEQDNIMILLINYTPDESDEIQDILTYNLNKLLSDNGLGEQCLQISRMNLQR